MTRYGHDGLYRLNQVIQNRLAACVSQLDAAAFQPTVEQSQIAPIGGPSIVCQALFQPETVEKAIDERVTRRGHVYL